MDFITIRLRTTLDRTTAKPFFFEKMITDYLARVGRNGIQTAWYHN